VYPILRWVVPGSKFAGRRKKQFNRKLNSRILARDTHRIKPEALKWVSLQSVEDLEESIGRIDHFLSGYRQ